MINVKKWSIVILMIVLIQSFSSFAYMEEMDAVEKWQAMGVIRGDEYGNLNLDEKLSRAALITMINRMFQIENTTVPEYDDVSSGLWYYDDVVAAVQKGYLKDEGTFRGDEYVTWAEAIDTIVRATGLSAPVNQRDMAIAQRKVDSEMAYSVAVMEKRGICSRTEYTSNPTKREVLEMLDRTYTQLFEAGGVTIDFSDSNRKVIDHNFEWDTVGDFPKNWFSEMGESISVKNENNNNYVAIEKDTSEGKWNFTRYFPPVTGTMSFETSIMTGELGGDKIGPALYSSRYRSVEEGSGPVLSMRISGSSLYATSGLASYKIADIEAGHWYRIRLDIDLDEKIYDIYIDDVLVKSNYGLNNNIAIGDITKVEYSIDNGQTGTLGIDDVAIYNSSRTEEALNAEPESDMILVDFQDVETGTTPVGWVHTQLGTTAVVEKSEETPNKYLKLEKPAVSSAGVYSRIQYIFPNTTGGIVQVEWRAKVSDITENYRYYTFSDHQIQVVFIGTHIYVMNHTRGFLDMYSGVEPNKWYNMKLILDGSTATYDLYVNGQKVGEDITTVQGGTVISNFWMQMAADSYGTMYVDDIKVTPLGTAEIPVVEGYNPDAENSAPENSAWMETYQKPPTGLVAEAEEMELMNFTTISQELCNGGKAVRVADSGNASATYTFDGESGYYAIKVGYLENTQTADSSHRVYHNGEEIDFWYGQFDDGLLHVRDVKNKRYVEKGDTFVLEGYSSADPATFDYIEFTDFIEPKFERGYLIQDGFLSPSYYDRSGWESSEAGGAARMMDAPRRYELIDNSAAENVWTKKRFIKQSGVVEAEINVTYLEAADGLSLGLRSGETEVIKVMTEGGSVYAVNAQGEKKLVHAGYQTDTLYVYKIRADLPNAKAVVWSGDGVPVELALTQADALDNFYASTSVTDKGRLRMSSVDVYGGYLLNETFKTYNSGVKPNGWVIEGEAYAEAVNNGLLGDRMAFTMKDGASAKINFSACEGTMTASFDFLMKESGSFGAQMNDISVNLEGGDLWLKAGGKTEKIWEKLKPNVYYSVLLEYDHEAGKLTAYVNYQKKVSIDYTGEAHDSIEFNVSGCDAVVDMVQVFSGKTQSNVPEPEKVDTGDYIIGMQTCDLWHEGDHFGWDSVRPYDNRTPLAGYYDDGNQEYVDWEIKWWAEHGVSLYFPCWYRDFTDTPLRETPCDRKLKAFMKSQYVDNMQFAICFENSGGVTSAEDFKENCVKYWIENYFKHPSYLVIDNKPVIGIWNHSWMAENLGGDEENARVFEEVEEMLRAEGFDGAIFITYLFESGESAAQIVKNRGYDYTYRYSFGDKPSSNWADFFTKQAQVGIIDGFSSPSQGHGAQAWGLAPRKINTSLKEFRNFLEWTRDVYIPSLPEDSLARKIILFDNWNEIAEGHAYTPTKITGFGYLDQIREVFSTAEKEHTDLVPENVYDALYPELWE